MNLNWRSIKNLNFNVWGAAIICVLVLVASAFLLWFEISSRSNINKQTIILIEAEQELLEDNTNEIEDLGEIGDFDSDNKNKILPGLLNERFNKLTTTKSSLLKKPSDYLQGISKSEYSDIDRQLFYERLGDYFVEKKEYEIASAIFTELAVKKFMLKRSGFYSALAYSKVGKTDKAISTYAEQLVHDPNHQASAMNYGLLLLQSKRYKESIPALQHAIDITSGTRKAKVLRHLGAAYEKIDQNEKALESYRQSIIFEPNNSKTWLLLGNALSSSKESVHAAILDALQKAILLEPDSYKARQSLANYHFSQLDFESARFEYTEATLRAGDIADLRLMQALNLFVSGRPQSAKKALNEINEASKKNELVAEFLNQIIQGDYVLAKKSLARLRKYKYLDSNLLVNLQLLYYVENKEDESLKSGRVEADLDSVFYWPSKLFLMRYLNKRKRYLDSESLGKDILVALPNSAEVLLVLARAQINLGKNDLALHNLAKAYKLQSSSRRISVEYINQLSKSKDYATALLVVDDVLKQNPNYYQAKRLKVDLLRQSNNTQEAIDLLVELFESGESSLEDGYALAELQYDVGKIEYSLQTLDQVLSIDSAHIKARQLRANILFSEARYIEADKEIELLLKLEPDNELAKQLQSKINQQKPKD